MGAVGESSWYPKAAAVCILLAFVLYLICFGAPNWTQTNPRFTDLREHIGLWRYCTYPHGGGESCNDFIDMKLPDWLKAAQSFMTISLFAYLGAIAVVIIYAFVPDFEGEMKILGAAMGTVGLTVLTMLIGVSIMGGESAEYFINKQPGIWDKNSVMFGWAFYVGIVSLLTTFVSLGFLLAELITGREEY